jgi:hypothetical protein
VRRSQSVGGLTQAREVRRSDEREPDRAEQRALAGAVVAEHDVPAGAIAGRLPAEPRDGAEVLDLDGSDVHGANVPRIVI